MYFLDIKKIKKEIRKVVRFRLKQITPDQQLQFAVQAASRIMKWPPMIKAHNIALFLSINEELNTQPLIEKLWCYGKKIYLPVIHPLNSNDLLFFQYNPNTRIVVNRLKFKEPEININNQSFLSLKELDIIVVPLVAFDKHGHRLGMGGGFYDRKLKNWQQSNVKLIGYAHDCQQVTSLPVEQWDISLPALVSPLKLWIW